MRVVGGRLRGRALAAPSGDAIRPTSDRLRESIFNVLAHGFGDPVPGARVLDLFAGTGALGIEALSRGAAFALFVEEDSAARGLIRQTVDAFGLGGATRLFRRDATRMGPSGPNGSFGLVFCDPPYGHDLAPAALRSCAEGGWLERGALAVVEERAGAAFAWPPDFEALDERRYGDTVLRIGRHGSA